MSEQQQQQQRVRANTPPAGGGLFDSFGSQDGGGLVTVAHGTYGEALPVAEMSVGEVRRRFRDRFDIHPGAIALVDGSPVDDDTTLRTGQLLSFVRPAGEKGGEEPR